MTDIRDHLARLSEQDLQPPQLENLLRTWKASGFEPKVIYDIGSCVLHWTKVAKRVWPNATYILFDAFDKAEFLYQQGGYSYHMGVLSDVDGKEVKFYQNDQLPGGNSYYREVGHWENVFPEDKYRICETRTLDSVVKERGFPLPDLVKIDVQGCERDILQGGWQTVKNASHLIVEMQHTNYNDGAPRVEHTLPWIESHGYTCVAPRFASSPVDADYGFIRSDFK